jgi:hypothetical protein
MPTLKKKSPVVKKPAKSLSKSVKKTLPPKITKPIKTTKKTLGSIKKKALPKKTASPAPQDKLAKEALKLVDKAASLLRKGIKKGSKATHEARIALHKEAHELLGSASSNIDHLLKSGASLLHSVIDKV